jgi:hypothetical protein
MLHRKPNIKLIRTNLRRQLLVFWTSVRSHTSDMFSQHITTVTIQDILMHEASLGSPKLCSGCSNAYCFRLFLACLTTWQYLRVRVVERGADHWTCRRQERFCRHPVADKLECSWRDVKRPHNLYSDKLLYIWIPGYEPGNLQLQIRSAAQPLRQFRPEGYNLKCTRPRE